MTYQSKNKKDDFLKEVKHIIIQFANVEYTIPNKEHVDVILTSLLPKYYIVVQSIVYMWVSFKFRTSWNQVTQGRNKDNKFPITWEKLEEVLIVCSKHDTINIYIYPT